MTELSKKTLVFGIGTGRCGTTSLAKLLNSQENAFVGHELSPILPWEQNINAIRNRILQLDHQIHAELIGDVGMYYLPYVDCLCKTNINDIFNLKFIAIKRDKVSTVNSLIKKLDNKYNPFQKHDGTKWEHYQWDKSFPKYDNRLTVFDACCKYWDEYYDRVEKLVEEFPTNVKCFDLNDMNSKHKVDEMLSFINIKNRNTISNIHINKSVSFK